jgi:dolichol-phosphate mannosyltransferase
MGLISFVLPAYNEETNIEKMVQRLGVVANTLAPDEVEIIFVDDHSADRTADVLRQICGEHSNVRFARLARRSGSHVAILCGLGMARGDCAIVLASDGQDPPELAPAMIAKWRGDNEVVWCARKGYKHTLLNRLCSGIFYWIMRRLARVSPESQNADMILLDRKVITALSRVYERNMYLWGLIDWFGFKQTVLDYDKAPRRSGKSGWTFATKIKVAIDSVIAFSYAPIRFISLVGVLISSMSFFLAMIYFVNHVTGGLLLGAYEVPGWASIVCAIFFLSGLQMLMLGVLGEYLWRTFDQVRGRPLYMVEEEFARGQRIDQDQEQESPARRSSLSSVRSCR